MFGTTKELTDTATHEIEMDRIRIDSGYKGKIIKELDLFNIKESSLFPEMESTAKYIKDKYANKKQFPSVRSTYLRT